MKKIIFIFLCILGTSLISNAQLIRHAKGTKIIGFNFSPTANGFNLQPHFNYFFNSKLNVGLYFVWENYHKITSDKSPFTYSKTENGYNYMVKPQLTYSFLKIKNRAYFNLSAGINIGQQQYEYYNHQTYPREVFNEESEIQVGPNIGLNCDIYIIKNLMVTAGGEYIVVSNTLYGKNNPHFVIGLGYNF